MDNCHFKNAESEPKFQKFQGRVVLRGDSVKGDPGAFAVFTEQGSSASQMTAAKVMDVSARLLDCDGQAADAVSAYTQVKMEDDPKQLRIPKSEYPQKNTQKKYGYFFHNINGPNLGLTLRIQWNLLNDTVTHSLAFCGKDSSWKYSWSLDGKKST